MLKREGDYETPEALVTLKLAGSFALLFAVAGCQVAPSGSLADDIRMPMQSPDGIGVSREAVTTGDGTNGAHIIYINFDGAALKGGNDNATTNTSQIAGGNVAYPAFDATPYAPMTADAAKATIAMYLTQYYAPFNAEIVTTRPTGKRYMMCMVGGTPSVVGEPGQAAGVALLDCGNSNESNVVFAFSKVLTPQNTGSATASLKAIAVTCAQETAHGYGLGHTTNTKDIMYPQLGNGVTGFGGSSNLQNDGSGQCSNGSTTQDSAGMLISVIGASKGGNPMTGPTPTVSFVTPTDGSTVPLTFDIVVAASETGGTISKVEISNGGMVLFTLTTPPFKKTVTAQSEGMAELTATAYDAMGNTGTATVDFTLMNGAPPQTTECLTKAECATGQDCVMGKCQTATTMPTTGCSAASPCPTGQTCQSDGTCKADTTGGNPQPKPGDIGASCTDSSECNSGLCATLGSTHFCTAACDPGNSTSCPTGTKCVGVAGSSTDHVCEPNNAASGGVGSSCSTTPGARPNGSEAILALCIALLAFVVRRSVRA